MAARSHSNVLSRGKQTHKKTSIGRKSVKTSSMNKRKKATFKKYKGQG